MIKQSQEEDARTNMWFVGVPTFMETLDNFLFILGLRPYHMIIYDGEKTKLPSNSITPG